MGKQWQWDTQTMVIVGFLFFLPSFFFPNSNCGDFFSLLIFIISIPFSSPRFNEKL